VTAEHETRALGLRSGACGLEQLDDVAGGILEQDLLAAWIGDDVVAERQAGGAEPLDLGRDVLDDEVDLVPAPGLRGAADRKPSRSVPRSGRGGVPAAPAQDGADMLLPERDGGRPWIASGLDRVGRGHGE